MFFYQKKGVERLVITKNNDRFVDSLAWSFDHWLVYLRTNAKPPLFLTNFEKITSFVIDWSNMGGLVSSHNNKLLIKMFYREIGQFYRSIL